MERRPGARGFFRNFREHDGTLREKLRLAARNNWRKVSAHEPCCGHPGEPGC